MNKTDAIRLLGGTTTSAAREIGISPQAVSQWPDVLPAAIADRVQAALARRQLPPEALGIQAVDDAAATGAQQQVSEARA